MENLDTVPKPVKKGKEVDQSVEWELAAILLQVQGPELL